MARVRRSCCPPLSFAQLVPCLCMCVCVCLAPRMQSSRGRQALFNTLSRLFDGLSDIAKAVLIILIADTLLGYHSEEGWTALIELLVGHYGFEAEEEGLVIFVGVVPVVIDVFFKYWIFIGLNRISPGAVITLKQVGLQVTYSV